MDKLNTDYSKYLILACATVMEELSPLMPHEMKYQVFDFGLHINPAKLKSALQDAINSASKEITHNILGYGLCSQAVVGLKSNHSVLIIPAVDDCISIFLGSRSAYLRQQREVIGTFYLTKGWLKVGSTPFDEFEDLAKKYGYSKARRITDEMLKNYTRLAFINSGSDNLEEYHLKTRAMAEKFNLKYEEIQGSTTLVRKMLFGPWDKDFFIVNPGETITFHDFMQKARHLDSQNNQ